MNTDISFTTASQEDREAFLKALLNNLIFPPQEVIKLYLKKPHAYLSSRFGVYRPAYLLDTTSRLGDKDGEIAINKALEHIVNDGLITDEKILSLIPDCVIVLVSDNASADKVKYYIDTGIAVIARIKLKFPLPSKLTDCKGELLFIIDEYETEVLIVENIIRNALFSIKEKLKL